MRLEKYLGKKNEYERFLVVKTFRRWSWKKFWFETICTEHIVLTRDGICWHDEDGYDLPFWMWGILEQERRVLWIRQQWRT